MPIAECGVLNEKPERQIIVRRREAVGDTQSKLRNREL